ncbi:hypothetical protein THAOC_18979, partial [Thalassiosira oceanica]
VDRGRDGRPADGTDGGTEVARRFAELVPQVYLPVRPRLAFLGHRAPSASVEELGYHHLPEIPMFYEDIPPMRSRVARNNSRYPLVPLLP